MNKKILLLLLIACIASAISYTAFAGDPACGLTGCSPITVTAITPTPINVSVNATNLTTTTVAWSAYCGNNTVTPCFNSSNATLVSCNATTQTTCDPQRTIEINNSRYTIAGVTGNITNVVVVAGSAWMEATIKDGLQYYTVFIKTDGKGNILAVKILKANGITGLDWNDVTKVDGTSNVWSFVFKTPTGNPGAGFLRINPATSDIIVQHGASIPTITAAQVDIAPGLDIAAYNDNTYLTFAFNVKTPTYGYAYIPAFNVNTGAIFASLIRIAPGISVPAITAARINYFAKVKNTYDDVYGQTVAVGSRQNSDKQYDFLVVTSSIDGEAISAAIYDTGQDSSFFFAKSNPSSDAGDTLTAYGESDNGAGGLEISSWATYSGMWVKDAQGNWMHIAWGGYIRYNPVPGTFSPGGTATGAASADGTSAALIGDGWGAATDSTGAITSMFTTAAGTIAADTTTGSGIFVYRGSNFTDVIVTRGLGTIQSAFRIGNMTATSVAVTGKQGYDGDAGSWISYVVAGTDPSNSSVFLDFLNTSLEASAINPNGTTRFTTNKQVVIQTMHPDINILGFRLDFQAFNGTFDTSAGDCTNCSFDLDNTTCQAEVEKVWGMFQQYNLTMTLSTASAINLSNLTMYCRDANQTVAAHPNCAGLFSTYGPGSTPCMVWVATPGRSWLLPLGVGVGINLVNFTSANLTLGTMTPTATCEQIACEIVGTWQPGNTQEFTMNKTITVTAI